MSASSSFTAFSFICSSVRWRWRPTTITEYVFPVGIKLTECFVTFLYTQATSATGETHVLKTFRRTIHCDVSCSLPYFFIMAG